MSNTAGKPRKPNSPSDWMALEFEVLSLFDGAPIDEEDLFAGRSTEVTKILQTVMERARHVVLYGERGVGKTSLSNVFWKRFNTTVKSFVVARVQAGPQDSFESLWTRAIHELTAAGYALGREQLVPLNDTKLYSSPSDVRRELQRCSANALPIIIIDEYNEVADSEARRSTANLIKELYDFTVSATILLVGVAENITDLIQNHNSVDRAIVQIPLARMSNPELKEIITKRANRTVMTFTGDAIWTIISLSRGLPYFTHILSKYAALNAIECRRTEVHNDDVDAAMDKFIQDKQTSFRDAYRDATRSNQENNFQQSLLACALAKTDEEGFFTANDVVEPYSAILRDKKRIAHFEKHLRRFSSDEGGNILIKRGGDRQQTFRFRDPMMQPYVIIRGIQSRMIDESAKSSLFQREQGFLFSTELDQ